MGRIFLTGDLHGGCDNSLSKFCPPNIEDFNLVTKDDVMIILGDYGMLWDAEDNISQREKDANVLMENLPFTTLFLDGNHENHPRLEKLPTASLYGGEVGKVSESVYHLRRGQIYTINGMSFFVMGGARSVDKHHRTEFVSWWKTEEPSYAEMNFGIDNLARHGNKVDYILTHDCPSTIASLIYAKYGNFKPGGVNKYFDTLYPTVDFKHWYFGHHHRNVTIGVKYSCLYFDIVEIKNMS